MPNLTESQQLTTADLANTANRHDLQEDENRATDDQNNGPLLARDFSDQMRSRWEASQAGFVDDPRISVQRADELVAMAIKRLAESFAEERAKLEHEWSQGNDVSTEDLRQGLRRYRSFFHRLLAV
jgi:hypothetical protein